MKIMVDLFAGLGGASSAFVEGDDWVVIRIDNNPDLLKIVPDLIVKDIMDEDIITFIEQRIKNRVEVWDGMIDLIWASPPCEQFSKGYHSKRSWCQRMGEPFIPDLTLFLRTLEIIDALKPTQWIIENVSGAREYLRPIMGGNRLNIGPFYLWGDMPAFNADLADFKKTGRREDRYGRKFRSNARAEIPYALSLALRQSLTYQARLTDYYRFIGAKATKRQGKQKR